jgi:hypothetical protein
MVDTAGRLAAEPRMLATKAPCRRGTVQPEGHKGDTGHQQDVLTVRACSSPCRRRSTGSSNVLIHPIRPADRSHRRVVNDLGDLLLVQKTDNDLWALPGNVMAYDDGEVRQQCPVCFTTRIVGGELRTSSETKEVRFVGPAELDQLNMYPSMRLRIKHDLERRAAPYIG